MNSSLVSKSVAFNNHQDISQQPSIEITTDFDNELDRFGLDTPTLEALSTMDLESNNIGIRASEISEPKLIISNLPNVQEKQTLSHQDKKEFSVEL